MPKSPDEVFTPRSSTVNVDMYVRRPDLERLLTNAITGTLLRKEFPQSTANKGLNTNQMLGEFCGGGEPILKKTPKGDGYMFADPKFRMCIRAMLKKNASNETVERIMINSIAT